MLDTRPRSATATLTPAMFLRRHAQLTADKLVPPRNSFVTMELETFSTSARVFAVLKLLATLTERTMRKWRWRSCATKKVLEHQILVGSLRSLTGTQRRMSPPQDY